MVGRDVCNGPIGVESVTTDSTTSGSSVCSGRDGSGIGVAISTARSGI